MQTRLLVVAALHPKFLFVVEGSSNYIVVSSFFYFHPEDWGNDPIWRFAYFSMWLVQPPTGNLVDIEKNPTTSRFNLQASHLANVSSFHLRMEAGMEVGMRVHGGET